MWAVPEVENMPGGSTGSEEDKLKMVSEGCNTSNVSYLHLIWINILRKFSEQGKEKFLITMFYIMSLIS